MLGKIISNKLRVPLEDEVNRQEGDQLWSTVGNQVGRQVKNEVWDIVWVQVKRQVWSQIWHRIH